MPNRRLKIQRRTHNQASQPPPTRLLPRHRPHHLETTLTNTTFKRQVFLCFALILLIAGCTTTSEPTEPWFVMTTTPVTRTNTPVISTTPASPTAPTGSVVPIPVGQGFGASKGFWQVYFTAPTGSRDASTYHGGVDEILAAQIAQVQQTLDIAAYEFNTSALTQAILAAKT